MLRQTFISAILIGFMSLSSVYAQNDPTATAILQKVEHTYLQFKNIDSQFKLTIEIPEESYNESQEGRLVIMKDMFRVEMHNQDIICDNKTIWTHLKDVNEVQVNYFEPDDNTIIPTELFSVYKNDYTSYFQGTKAIGNKKINIIDLIPNDKEQVYFKIRLEIDSKTNLFNSFKVFSKDGATYTYDILSFAKDLNLSTTDFQFSSSQYPGIEIIDLR